MRTRDDDLRSARRVPDFGDVHAQALALVIAFRRDLLGARHDRFGAVDLYDDRAGLDALDDAVDDLTLALGELVEHQLAFGVPQLLHDDLFRRLSGDAAELRRSHVFVDLLAGLGVRKKRLTIRPFECARLLQYDQIRVVLYVVGNVLDDGEPVVDMRLAGLGVDLSGD